jgi:hypothetical protein
VVSSSVFCATTLSTVRPVRPATISAGEPEAAAYAVDAAAMDSTAVAMIMNPFFMFECLLYVSVYLTVSKGYKKVMAKLCFYQSFLLTSA